MWRVLYKPEDAVLWTKINMHIENNQLKNFS